MKKILSLVLTFMLLASFVPVLAMADEPEIAPFSISYQIGDGTITTLEVGTKTSLGYQEAYSGLGDLYEVALPAYIGTTLPENSNIILEYNESLITYYYKGSYSYELSKVIGGTYLGASDFMNADGNNYTLGTKSDILQINTGDNSLNYIQVQTPYVGWTSSLSFAIKLTYSDGSTGVVSSQEDPIYTDSQLRANIANYYVTNGITNDGNRAWLVTDMMVYENTYQTTKMTDAQKKAYVDMAISEIDNATIPGDIAKNIISLVSLGYDPKNITTATGKSVNALTKLTKMCFTNNDFTATSNNYSVPAILVAYEQFGTEYETEINKIITYCLSISDETNGAWAAFWDPTSIDLDLTAPMLLALAPYYSSNNDVKTVIDNTKAALTNGVVPSGGLVNYDSVETTGKLVAALVAINENPSTFFGATTSTDLIYGIRSKASSDGDGFVNYLNTRDTMSTEQGFRGLMAAANYSGYSSFNIYDFSSNISSREPAIATPYSVVINVVPNDAIVTISQNADYSSPIDSSVAGVYAYSLANGNYYYKVEKQGYYSKEGTINVTDVTKQLTEYVSLTTVSSGTTSEDNKLTVNVKLMEHSKTTECNNGTSKISYKKNSSLYTNALSNKTIKVDKGTNLRDAFIAVLDKNNISYIEKSNGYFSSIDGISEYDHGSYSGWMYLLNGTAADNALNYYSVNEDVDLTFYYTDYYPDESGSESWSSSYIPAKASIETKNECILDKSNIEEVLKSGADISFVQGNIEISKDAFASIIKNRTGAISISMNKITDTKDISNWDKVLEAATNIDLSKTSIFKLTLNVGDINVTNFGGKAISNKFNVDTSYEPGLFYKVLVLSQDRVETKAGKCVKAEDGSLQISVDTYHYSIFVITKEECSSDIGDVNNIFEDINEEHWALSDLQAIYDLGLMTGTSINKFSPSQTLPGTHVKAIFARLGYDIEDLDNTPIQRQIFANVLYNYANKHGDNGQFKEDLSSVSDRNLVDPKYRDGVCWAKENKLISGRTITTVNPTDILTRAECAAIIVRFINRF